MYVITGATSRTGSRIATSLLTAGQPVRVIGRNLERLQPLVALGAQAFVAEASDGAALARAFDGAHAVWVMLQPNYIPDSPDFRGYQRGIVAALHTGLLQARVPYVVALSSWGAGQAHGTGPVAGLRDMELALNSIAGLNCLHLRAGYFMENLVQLIDSVAKQGRMLSPFDGDIKLPLVATADVAEVAVQQLLTLGFQGSNVLELQGAGEMTMAQVASHFGALIGQPGLAYEQASPALFAEALRSVGSAENVIALMLEVATGINSGHIAMETARRPATTSGTTFAQFAERVMLPAWRAMAAGVPAEHGTPAVAEAS